MGLQQPSSTDYVLSISIDEYRLKIIKSNAHGWGETVARSVYPPLVLGPRSNTDGKIARISLCRDFHYFTVKSIDYIL